MAMRVKVARALLVAILVLLVAVTPLSAFLSPPAVFETWLPGWGEGYPSAPRVQVVLRDHTGLVKTMAPAEAERPPSTELLFDQRVLVVSWTGGCGDLTTHLTFSRVADEYVVEERTYASGCSLLIGYARAVALHLWLPLDPGLVSVRSGR